jgi:hypothetical protein
MPKVHIFNPRRIALYHKPNNQFLYNTRKKFRKGDNVYVFSMNHSTCVDSFYDTLDDEFFNYSFHNYFTLITEPFWKNVNENGEIKCYEFVWITSKDTQLTYEVLTSSLEIRDLDNFEMI